MYQTFKALIDEVAAEQKERAAFRWFYQKELYEKKYEEFNKDLHHLLQQLEEGMKERGHIGIIGPNSYEWALAYMGVMYSNHVIIPIDKELPSKAMAGLINMGDIDTLIVVKNHKEIIEKVKIDLHVRRLIFINSAETGLTISSEIINEAVHHNSNDTPPEVKKIMFTSGTTGKSKGVMLTEAGILADLHSFRLSTKTSNEETFYNLLPMHHMYAAVADLTNTILSGGTLCININPLKITTEIPSFKPYCIHMVPLIAESFMRMANLAVKNQQFASIADYFGGRLEYIVCSGAVVPEKLIRQYEEAGIPVLRGYGLTEATAGVTSTGFETRGRNYRTVGTPISCNEVRIKDGEIQVKGSNVMIGYYKNPEATAAAFEDGWLKTGDLGEFDNGDLYITGRSKNIIILSNGKNIYPEEIEEYFSELPAVEEIMVFEGSLTNGNQVLAAAIYSENGNQDEIQKAVDDINGTLPSYKQVAKVVFVSSPLEKTTTRKIKRDISRQKVIYESTFQKVRNLLSEVIYVNQIEDDSNLVLDLRLDSFSTMDFLSRCEECFDISVDVSIMKNIKTVGDMVHFIMEKSNYKIA